MLSEMLRGKGVFSFSFWVEGVGWDSFFGELSFCETWESEHSFLLLVPFPCRREREKAGFVFWLFFSFISLISLNNGSVQSEDSDKSS